MSKTYEVGRQWCTDAGRVSDAEGGGRDENGVVRAAADIAAVDIKLINEFTRC